MPDREMVLPLVADVISAYLGNGGNEIRASDIPSLITSVASAFSTLDAEPVSVTAPSQTRITPAQIRKSITPDYLTSFEDGRQLKSLKRHLTTHGLTPAEYRQKWGLPADYPMVAPNYSAARSEMAKKTGLGARGGRTAAPAKKN